MKSQSIANWKDSSKGPILSHTLRRQNIVSWYIVGPFEGLRIMCRQYRPPGFLPVRIYENPVTVKEVDIGIAVEEIAHIRQTSGQQDIVAVQVAHYVTGYGRKAEVDRMGLAAVWLDRKADGGIDGIQ